MVQECQVNFVKHKEMKSQVDFLYKLTYGRYWDETLIKRTQNRVSRTLVMVSSLFICMSNNRKKVSIFYR